MQSGSVGLSQKLSRPIDGASLVAASPQGSLGKWTQISVHNKDGLASVVNECVAARAAILTGPYRALPRAANDDREFVFVDMTGAKLILDHEPQDQVISVQTGITLQELNAYLMPFGQWFPVSAPADSTLIDIINRGDGGLLEHGFGAVRDLILGLELVTGSGAAIKSGGKVVKNVTGYDTTKLFVGSHATLAIAHAAHLRLFARPEGSVNVIFNSPNPQDLLLIANDLIGADLSLTCVELIDFGAILLNPRLSESTLKFVQRLKPYGLLVRVSGHDDLLKEILPQVRSFKKESVANVEIPIANADNLIELCSVPRYPSLELSASVSEMTYIFNEWWCSVGSPFFQYRPATGRTFFYPRDLNLYIELTESLRSFLVKKGAPSTVAFAATEYEYEIEYLAPDVKEIGQIKAAIKERFDPSQCLNPLAAL